jgi:hypothetical protein
VFEVEGGGGCRGVSAVIASEWSEIESDRGRVKRKRETERGREGE